MKLSIIVPVYNTSKYLNRCLSSLCNQSVGGGYEIILVNDGSTDDSLNILERWANNYPQLIKVCSQPNSGVSAARNLGINNCSGEWIAFCDSDDYVAANSFGELINIVSNSTVNDLELVKYGMCHVRENEKITDKLTFNIQYIENNTAYFINHLFWACWHFLYKRSVLIEYNIRFHPVISSEDALFNIEYLLCTKAFMVLGIDAAIYRYVSNPNSTCNRRDFTKASSFLSSYYHVFNRLNEIQKTLHNHNLIDRIDWVKAKTLPNLYSRLIRSNLTYKQIAQHCKKICQLMNLPSCIRTQKQRLMEFQICHPLAIVFVRFAYKQKIFLQSHLAR